MTKIRLIKAEDACMDAFRTLVNTHRHGGKLYPSDLDTCVAILDEYDVAVKELEGEHT